MSDEPRKIEVDIGQAVAALTADPELCRTLNELVGGPALTAAHDEIDRLTSALAESTAEVARLRHANSTRPDYDLYCHECGRAHVLDTSIPSEIWNQIAEREDILCAVCIDARLTAAGLGCEAELYYVGTSLKSKLYGHHDLAERDARIAELEEGLRPFAELADITPIMAGRGEDTRPRSPADDERFDYRAMITWGHMRRARTLVSKRES